jgi:hypothetical protein
VTKSSPIVVVHFRPVGGRRHSDKGVAERQVIRERPPNTRVIHLASHVIVSGAGRG